jgi:competence protein ComEC
MGDMRGQLRGRGLRKGFLLVLTMVAIAGLIPVAGDGALTIYFIDVEGGQATLIVTPDRQALLVDAGFPGFDDRDPKRILVAVHDAGLTRLDYLLLTHFHQDHIGGVPAIAAQLPIGAFIDHGALVDHDRFTVAAFEAYEPVRYAKRQIHPKVGDRLPLKDVDIEFVSASGETSAKPVPGGGRPNPSCATLERQADDPGENAQSIGMWLRYGRFRFLDLGDLNWNKLAQLVCPANLLGPIDVYLVSHHGNLDANLPQLLVGVQPRVAVIDNSPTKGGAPETFSALHHLAGLEAVWQLHRSARQGAENFADEYVANPDGPDEGHWLKVTASRDGSFNVVNSRNGASQTYRAAH